MKPVRVAVFHRGDPYRYARVDGGFQYPVPALIWEQFQLSKKQPRMLKDYADKFDVAWLDEGKYKRYKLFNPVRCISRPIPVIHNLLYPTLNDSIFTDRVARCKEHVDAVLLDHDRLERWQKAFDYSIPVRRLAYSVDESRYFDRGYRRDIDVGFYCVYAHNAERPAMHEWLADFCKRKGWVYLSTKGENVGDEYPLLLSRTKVVLHMTRTPRTRPPRIFDTAASKTALLSNPMPKVSGEHFAPWIHYAQFSRPYSKVYVPFGEPPSFQDKDCEEVAKGLEWLLDEGHWEHIAERAHEYVMACHTWRVRAIQLRGIILDLFPQIKERIEND